MRKTVTVGPMQIVISATKERPIYQREREVLRQKFMNSTPHRLRMTIGLWSAPRTLPYRPAYMQSMAA
jgi:hypothetical protein